MIRNRIAMLAVLLTLLPHPGVRAEPVYRVDLESGLPVSTSVEPVPQVVETGSAPPPQERLPGPIPPRRKLHPLLLSFLESSAPRYEKVVIAFADTVPIPRFPELDPDLPRMDAKNEPARAAAEKLVRDLQGKRAATYEQHKAEIAAQGGKVLETFWLIDAVVAEMPVTQLLSLADSEEVLSIVPVNSDEPPPASDGIDWNDVDDGRRLIGSDLYFNLGGGFIGLLDTGVRSAHRLFKEPSTIDLQLDCVNGGANCTAGGNPDDDCWNHGTSTAAILTGNTRLDDRFRGVTKITVDSFKVYPSVFKGKACDRVASALDTAAAVRGFQAAVAALDKVIVAEIQQRHQDGPVSRAANAAFDAGAVVVAANGNRLTDKEKVASPAAASRALGVGNFDVGDGRPIESQRAGPTEDDRIKPDLQAPTNTETAGNSCLYLEACPSLKDDEALRPFGGTSGATPYAAGAAALLRNLVARAMKTNAVDPGFVYGLMILSGQRTSFDNDHGVGPLKLPANGSLLWGVVDVRHGNVFEIPVMVLPHQKIKIIDTALWWPEDWGRHNNVDLTIDGPNGEHEKSESVPSVFERARFKDMKNGKWRIRVHGKRIPLGPQRVYFAILLQP